MRNPLAVALRSITLTTAILVASVGTTLAHAGETHADASPGRWSAVGWIGVAAVVALVLVIGLSTRHRPEVPTALPDNRESTGRQVAEQNG